ncbi:hypothetical protein PMAYCL1PPCAC_02923 [Pristionchus mayeri]|uniref:BZIP domain-containing protein n=1 Tax=Pristionchus mayeri TaxID=1317129 RepID=A0AAN4Z698_9BILA|nr:hypothetical protein PMAYCL1PPCAC_02923 [Pristionchus mayeri]
MIFSHTMSFNTNHNAGYNNYNNQMYGRQESTQSVDSLQQVYTKEMENMLETPIDLADYMFEDMESDWPLEDQPQMDAQQPSEKQQTAQFYQEQVQYQQALYHDIADSHYGGGYGGSDYSPNFDPHPQGPPMMAEVKSEPDEDEYGRYEKESASPIPSTSRHILSPPINRNPRKDPAKALEEYKPQTKARGYKIKPEEVKADPTYKLKRARNNDAVRKSRSKAKEQQMERERELSIVKERCAALEKENKTLKQRLSKYEKI